MSTLKKIQNISDLGIFKGFTWNNLSEFKQINTIFGYNASGKTTLSRLFTYLNNPATKIEPGIKYKVIDSDGSTFTETVPFPTHIHVFNSDFVEANVDFTTSRSGTINIVLGEENLALLQAIHNDEAALSALKQTIENKKYELAQLKKDRDNLFTEVAKGISQALHQVTVRTYNRLNAQKDYAALSPDAYVLNDEELESAILGIEQKLRDKITILSFSLSEQEERAFKDIPSLMSQTVSNTVIERLKENSDIAEWVEQGLKLREKHKERICEFCGQPLPETRIKALLEHFNDADQRLKDRLDLAISLLCDLYLEVDAVVCPDKARLYDDLAEEYLEMVQAFDQAKKDLLASIMSLGNALKEKKAHTTENYRNYTIPDFAVFTKAIATVNTVIEKHNQITESFDTHKRENEIKIRNHYLAEIRPKETDLASRASALEGETSKLENDEEIDSVKVLTARIVQNRGRISTAEASCEKLNETLYSFLGRDEIKFAPSEDDSSSYAIMRGDKKATKLSEGEKTALSFVFFITSLQGADVDKEKDIIVVDDPVSSLDSNSIFQAFSYLKNTLKDFPQAFIFTHDFKLLKLLINWLQNGMTNKSAYYMVKNSFSNDFTSRTAYIDILDDALFKYETEYQFLFHTLCTFVSDQTIENVYNIPNIMRKFLETFLAQRIPTKESPYKRLEKIPFDEIKKTAIYKFANDSSHMSGEGFEPSLVQETDHCLHYLFEMIKSVDEEYYNRLLEAVGMTDPLAPTVP